LKREFDIAVAGGGAAGFFAAIHAADGGKNRVVILEKTGKLLTKVLVSGGGRCNVTHHCQYASHLVKSYPRGGKSLKKPFELFGPFDTVNWFETRGVKLKTEPDGRMFPVSDQSQTIVDCLKDSAERAGVEVLLHSGVAAISQPEKGGFLLGTDSGNEIFCKKLIITTGGHSKLSSYQWLQELGISIVPPVPSLFTFNVPDSGFKDLMGVSVPEAMVQIPGTKWKQEGPLLITHWGFSGPAVIVLSARAAIDLHERNYHFEVLINWTARDEHDVRGVLTQYRNDHPKRVILSNALFALPGRLWERICNQAGIPDTALFRDLTARMTNKLAELLVRSPFEVKGKTTFKEEFVTCGGVSLEEVDLTTFESRKIQGLYFAGEVLNADGLTGGFNFQHAWTSGYLAGTSAAAQR
jgi:predicted Rossmann fold flavoprotein